MSVGAGVGVGIDQSWGQGGQAPASGTPVVPGNLVTNAGFDDTSNWTLAGTSIAISGGKLNVTGGSGTKTATQTSATSLTQGTIYKSTFDVSSYSAGTVTLNVGAGGGGTARSAAGTFTQYFKAGSGQNFVLSFGSFPTISVDNVIILVPTETGTGSDLVTNGSFTETNLIANGTFGDDTGWDFANGGSVVGGSLVLEGGDGATGTLSPAGAITGVTYTLTATGGNAPIITASGGNVTTTPQVASGTYSESLGGSSSSTISIQNGGGSDTQALIDDLAVLGIASWDRSGSTGFTGGKAVFSNDGTLSAIASSAPVAGHVYRVAFTIDSISAGGATVTFGGKTTASRTSSGTYSEDIIATSTSTAITVTGAGGIAASIDGLSIKEVLYA